MTDFSEADARKAFIAAKEACEQCLRSEQAAREELEEAQAESARAIQRADLAFAAWRETWDAPF